ncbi:MAG: hypothetical protein HY074_06030 [Deltaproteobacteria bacterium]|nr:hypothetical protein [Deltaproteobacteria bacterium]
MVLARVAADKNLAQLRDQGEIVGSIHNAYDTLGTASTGGFHVDLVRSLVGTLKGPIELGKIENVDALGSLSDAIVLDLNERLICSDDFNLQVLLRKGAVLQNSPLQGQKDFIHLSGHHGFGIYEIPKGTRCIWQDAEVARVKDYLTESYRLVPPIGRYGDYPWPLWMEEFGLIVARKLRSARALENGSAERRKTYTGAERTTARATVLREAPKEPSLSSWVGLSRSRNSAI